MFRIKSICLYMALVPFSLSAQNFIFNQNEGMEYRIVSEVNESVWADSELLGQSEILNRISVEVLSSDEEAADLRVQYSISEKSLDTGLYVYAYEEEREFSRSHRGLYGNIPDDEYLPSVRNIPTWPEKEVRPGSSWAAMALEVHDLKPFFGIDYRLHIPYRVFYNYTGTREYEGRTVDVIEINYHFLQNIDALSFPPGTLPPAGTDLPVAVSGDFRQVYLWDPEAGIPAAVAEEFKIAYSMATGFSYIFKGSAEGRVIEADQWIKEDVKEEISKAVEEMEDVSVSVNDDGIVLTLEDIHFKPDSPEFLPGEREKLYRLKELLLQFPEHDLMITGHTARIGYSPDEGQRLSEERAAAVASFFLQEEVREASQMVVQGKGSREPVGDNSSEEGRRKNRRVEITILDN